MRDDRICYHFKMKLLKIFVIVLICGLFASACWSSKPQRYVISESKAYEASLFRQNCVICHGPEGEGKTLSDGRQIPNLRDGEFKYKTDSEIYHHIADGGNGMVPFRGQLTDREINLMVRFVQDQLRNQNR
jgi:mono/diheme cytochrome c family protein